MKKTILILGTVLMSLTANSQIETIETKLNLIGRSMDKEEQEYFNSIVSELDKLVDTIKIEL